MEEQEAPSAVVPDECSGQAVWDDAPFSTRNVNELIADGDKRGPGSLCRDPTIPPLPAIVFRRGIYPAEEGLDGRPTVVSLNALAWDDRDIGVIGEQSECSAEILLRKTAAEIVDRCENVFDIGRAGHRPTISQSGPSEPGSRQAARSDQATARLAR
jgi:hypothetical protein